ncbi:MAG: c-type cytochrome, partial [Lewinella sp.]|nr:c-type cytochrome [Lewinella sp.]
DGDDRVDERKLLYTGFQYKDTHGMVNNFVRSWDGWIHADHGFSNSSRVAGSDGDTIVLTSGNTFRFRMDGSHLEFTTTGRVNPFGYAYDELGYEYSTDCHTSPVYQLVRGADYPHFGKQPTGIGFGPALMKHTYGSTALAGLDYYIADQFPEDFRYNFYYGDVVLSRVSRSNFVMKGTTPVITQEEDFIISDDPWFRPVDVKLGPDGAIYIADFYNRIIGHYEVPLDHPGRDRQRGRIWRIVYTGKGAKNPEKVDYSQKGLAELTAMLNHPNLPLRMAIADAIVDRFGAEAIPAMQQLINEDAPTHTQIQALWILYRLNGLETPLLQKTATSNNDTLQVHSLRVMFEMDELDPALLKIVESQLEHSSPHVRRQAVMVVSQHPATEHVSQLLELLDVSDEEDTHFYYSIRQSLRDQIRDRQVLSWVNDQNWEEKDARRLADVMVGVDETAAGNFLLAYLAKYDEPLDTRKRYVKHAARWLPATAMDQLVAVLEPIGKDRPDEDYPVFLSMLDGMEQAGKTMSNKGKAWAARLATDFLRDPVEQYGGWRVMPMEHQRFQGNTWAVLDSTGGDARSNRLFIRGGLDNHVSIMQSPTFDMPAQLSFTLIGRKNEPGKGEQPTPPANSVELVLAENGEVLASADVTEPEHHERISWNADSHEGQKVFFRLVDGSAGWRANIGIGELEPQVVAFPEISPVFIVERQRFATRIAVDYQLKQLTPELQQLLAAPVADVEVRSDAAKALMSLNAEDVLANMRSLLTAETPAKLKELWLVALSGNNLSESRELIAEHMSEIPYESQKEAVLNIGSNRQGIDFLLDAARDVRINPRLLLELQVVERLQAMMSAAQKNRYQQLMADVAPPAENIDQLIADRLKGYSPANYSIEKGKTHFSVYCGICHKVGEEGGNIGPQLTSIGNWGAQALSEKILDPNRNISKAFQMYTIQLKDGSVKSGLLRREEGEVLVLADAAGQEFSIEKSEIKERKPSAYTLMPDTFREVIPEEDFKDLLAYLLSLTSDQ